MKSALGCYHGKGTKGNTLQWKLLFLHINTTCQQCLWVWRNAPFAIPRRKEFIWKSRRFLCHLLTVHYSSRWLFPFAKVFCFITHMKWISTLDGAGINWLKESLGKYWRRQIPRKKAREYVNRASQRICLPFNGCLDLFECAKFSQACFHTVAHLKIFA